MQKVNKKPKKKSKYKTLRRGKNFKLDKKKTQEEKMINQVPTKP